MECPVTSAELVGALLAEFRRMDETDLEGCAGLEGDGWLWTRPDDVVVAADQVGDQIIFNVVDQAGAAWLVVGALGQPRAIASAAA